jgi:purine nucleoside phosphorylase
MLQANPTTAC